MRVAALLLIVCTTAAGATLAARIASLINTTPETRQAIWGIRVVDAATGRLLFARNDRRFFVPASNTKLFTAALALTRLGPDHRFHTTVEASASPDAAGIVHELRLVGGGDPNLSARLLPYQRDDVGPNPLAAIESLAEAVIARGVRVVDGDIIGDDSAWVWEPYPEGWAVDDPVWEYGAPVSALSVNDNAFTLEVEAGVDIGAPARLAVWPALEYLTIHNRTTTIAGGTGKLTFDRVPGSRELVIRGGVALYQSPYSAKLAVDDPALFAAYALRDALVKRGVRVTGAIRAAHRRDWDAPSGGRGIELARYASAPLAEILQVVNKVSQNLHAEMMLREVARVKHGVGSRKHGLEELTSFLAEIGIEETEHHFEDASGLSRLNLVTPAAVSALLLYMYNSPHREVWTKTLPIGGEDGTLEVRFTRARSGNRIRAKTGSISHVSALSGYALRRGGRTLVFSILANNYNSGHVSVRRVMDRIALALLH